MREKFNIVPEKTAITNGVSTSCKKIISDFKNKKDSIEVLDYGCGRLRNTKYLIENEFSVSIVDTKTQISANLEEINKLPICNFFNLDTINQDKKYNIILVSYVLNVIPNKESRLTLLKNVYNLLTDDGLAYIEVRNVTFLKNLKNKIPYEDGFLTGSGENKTFQKAYLADELKEYLEDNMFNVNSIFKTSGSIIAIINKREV